MDKWKKYLIIDSNSKEDHCTGHRTEGTEALNWDTCTFVYSKESLKKTAKFWIYVKSYVGRVC